MFRRKGKTTLSKTEKGLIDELLSLLVKLVGESVKDKVVRAILIGAIASVGSYTAIEADIDPEVELQLPALPVPEFPVIEDKSE